MDIIEVHHGPEEQSRVIEELQGPAELDIEKPNEEEIELFDLNYDDTEVEQLSKEEEEVLKEIQADELDEDIEEFLKNTENVNTRTQTEVMVSKYHRVMKVVAKKKKQDFLPLDSTPRSEIPKLLATFFRLIRTKKGDVYNASSYTTFLGCFTRYLADTFEPPIDVSKDICFKMLRTTVSRLKAKAEGTKGKKPGENAARVVSARHLKQAWTSGAIGRADPDSLNAAAYLAFTTGLGCRAVTEVTSVTNRAVIFGPIDPKHNLPEWIELDEEWVCKNRRGNDPRILEARITPDHKYPETCMVRTVVEFQRRKTENQKLPEKRFFWNVNDVVRKNPGGYEKWFKNCFMGRHTVEKLLTNALSKAGIDCKKEKYSATSARKVMLDGGQDAGIPQTILGRMAGQRSEQSKKSYIANKDLTHRAAMVTLNRVGAGKTPRYQEILDDLQEEDLQKLAEKGPELSDDDDFEHTISQSRIMNEFGSVEVIIEQKQGKNKPRSPVGQQGQLSGRQHGVGWQQELGYTHEQVGVGLDQLHGQLQGSSPLGQLQLGSAPGRSQLPLHPNLWESRLSALGSMQVFKITLVY